MPILFIITAISGNYPDIARNPNKYFFLQKAFYIKAHFFLAASRSRRICFVAAHSQWMTTSSRAIEESVVIS